MPCLVKYSKPLLIFYSFYVRHFAWSVFLVVMLRSLVSSTLEPYKIPNKTFGQHFKGQRPVLYQCFIAEQLQFNFYYSLVFSPVRY